jgi:hypothetical protein
MISISEQLNQGSKDKVGLYNAKVKEMHTVNSPFIHSSFTHFQLKVDE